MTTLTKAFHKQYARHPGARAGVGDVQVFGSEYAMRIWLDPAKLAAYSLMPSDVETALENQNTQVSYGQIGAPPTGKDQQLVATVRFRSRLQTPGAIPPHYVKN